MSFATTDLLDAHPERARPLAPVFRDFGGKTTFRGVAVTVVAPEDNTLVRAALETEGRGRVLVVDGGGSLGCALLGGNLAALAAQNGWAGAIVFGCVRDVRELAAQPIGVKALAAFPRKSDKKGRGARDVAVTFAGQTIAPGDWVYADEDGVVVAATEL